MKWAAWLTAITLIVSLSLYSQDHISAVNKLDEIRTWAHQTHLWPNLSQEPNSLIAVREVYSVEQSQLQLKAYLLVPCISLCGGSESCARHCQEMMRNWDGDSPEAKLIIEGFDLKEQRSLGRLVLDQVAPIALRYWSRQQALISLIQSTSSSKHTLHLIRVLPHASHSDRDTSSSAVSHRKRSSAGNSQRLQLTHYDSIELGAYHGQESPLEGSVSFRDLDGDDKVDLIAPFEPLVSLDPLTVFVPTPYRLTNQGLELASDLIKINPPSKDQLRTWLVSIRGDNDAKPTIERAKRLFSFSLLLCLKGEYDKADELVRFAYPQYTPILHLWSQLKKRLDTKPQGGDRNTRSDPFSVLDH